MLDYKTSRLLRRLESYVIHNEGHQYLFAVSQYITSHHKNIARIGTKTLLRNLDKFYPEALRFLNDLIDINV